MGKSSRSPSNCPRSSKRCARCLNHNLSILLKGHKRYCQFSDCECLKCTETLRRQKKMAKQVATRRAEDQDKQCLENGVPLPSQQRQSAPPSPMPHSLELERPGQPERSRTPSPEPWRTPPTSGQVWGSILVLLNRYELRMDTMPLLHVILKRIINDPEVVYRLIKEGMRLI